MTKYFGLRQRTFTVNCHHHHDQVFQRWAENIYCELSLSLSISALGREHLLSIVIMTKYFILRQRTLVKCHYDQVFQLWAENIYVNCHYDQVFQPSAENIYVNCHHHHDQVFQPSAENIYVNCHHDQVFQPSAENIYVNCHYH
ncbi:hypothetical protein BsWGS_27043 [Bradybaena similaris]